VEEDVSRAVDEAMRLSPRASHLPADQVRHAGLDRALPIGHEQTSSQPTTVRNMLIALDARPGHRVLDVGSGSGWTTVLLARLVGPTGSVLGVERVPELPRWGAHNVTAAGMPWARVAQATPSVLGAPDGGPYDRILVSAEAGTLPRPLLAQLTSDGVMVIPVARQLLRVRMGRGGSLVDRLGPYVFVPLVEEE